MHQTGNKFLQKICLFHYSFKQILGLSKFLDPLFQVRRGSKPRLVQNRAKNRKLNSPEFKETAVLTHFEKSIVRLHKNKGRF